MLAQRCGYAAFKTGKRLNDVPALLGASDISEPQASDKGYQRTRIPSSPHRISDITAVTAATISVVCSVSWRVGQMTLRTSVLASRAKATVALPLSSTARHHPLQQSELLRPAHAAAASCRDRGSCRRLRRSAIWQQLSTSSLPCRARSLSFGIRTHKPTCQKYSTNIFTPQSRGNPNRNAYSPFGLYALYRACLSNDYDK